MYPLGDPTMSVMEIWGAEYQENNALLLDATNRQMFDDICSRENCPYCVVGTVTSTGRVVVRDSQNGTIRGWSNTRHFGTNTQKNIRKSTFFTYVGT